MRYLLIATGCLTACGLADRDARHSIVGEPECSACSIRLVRVTSLQADQPVSSPRFPSFVIRLRGGGYAMGPTYEPGTAAVFSGNGRLVGVLGRHGSGPGEMREVRSVSDWPGDTVAVVHDGGRISLFDQEHRYARSLTLDSPPYLTNRVTPLPDGALLARRYGTFGGADVALREFSTAGEPLRGYGPSTEFGSGRIYADVAIAADTVWAVNHTSYEMDVFSRASGTVRETIHRVVEWFPREAVRNDWGGQPTVEGFGRYQPGTFLVLLRRPRADFSLPAPGPPTGEVAPAAPRQPDHFATAERFEQVLELLDLDKGQILAQLHLDHQWIGGFIDEDEVYTYEWHPQTGDIGIGIWQIKVTGLPQP